MNNELHNAYATLTNADKRAHLEAELRQAAAFATDPQVLSSIVGLATTYVRALADGLKAMSPEDKTALRSAVCTLVDEITSYQNTAEDVFGEPSPEPTPTSPPTNCPFKVGGTYPTRDGRTAEITAINIDTSSYPVTGVVGCELYIWTLEGRFWDSSIDSPDDLIKEETV